MIETLTSLIAMTPPSDGGSGPGIGGLVLQLGLIFLVFWFVLIAPMRRKQKKHQALIAAMKPGDKVVTNGGIYATVTAVGDATVHVKIAEQVKIEIAKSAVAGFQGQAESGN
jgi:preprotein translocase subunit YajC